MSHGRKTNDGSLAGRDIGLAEWGDTLGGKGKTGQYDAPKRTAKNAGYLTAEEDLFHEDGEKDRYLITYADLITLLLGLFIILYSISNIDASKYKNIVSAMGNIFGNKGKVVSAEKGVLPEMMHKEVGLKTQLTELIEKYHYNNSIRLEENSRGITIHILDDVLFASGNADLTSGSKEVLSRLAVILRQLPNDIRIEGHTDNVPINTASFPSNWHLSVARALNTAYYLINSEKLSADKVSIVGFSKYKPIDSNESASGRANNRRVDIVIIRSNKNENNNSPIWRN